VPREVMVLECVPIEIMVLERVPREIMALERVPREIIQEEADLFISNLFNNAVIKNKTASVF